MTLLDEVVVTLDRSVDAVRQMARFDRLVLSTVESLLVTVDKAHDAAGFQNPKHRVKHVIKAVQSIQENQSLAPKYQEMYNQCAVLLTSHLTAGLTEALRIGLAACLERDRPIPLTDKLRVTAEDLRQAHADTSFGIADLILAKTDYTLQDMKSTRRAFSELLGLELDESVDMHNVVVLQNARHKIVHDGALATREFMRATAVARDAMSLDLVLIEGEKIRFGASTVDQAADSVSVFVRATVAAIPRVLGTA